MSRTKSSFYFKLASSPWKPEQIWERKYFPDNIYAVVDARLVL